MLRVIERRPALERRWLERLTLKDEVSESMSRMTQRLKLQYTHSEAAGILSTVENIGDCPVCAQRKHWAHVIDTDGIIGTFVQTL